MPSVTESLSQKSPLRTALEIGLEQIDQLQTVTFTQYQRVVLPADGYVFWVKATLLGPSAAFNVGQFNAPQMDQPSTTEVPAKEFEARGSLHVTSEKRQEEDQSFALHRVVFTAEEQVNPLNAVNPNTMYIATVGTVSFAFAQSDSYYRQADLHHYSGDAVYPPLSTQIINTPEELNTREVIVSNSLPIWLALTQFGPVYPSFLVPDNLVPPYIVAHIGEEDTATLAPLPSYDLGLISGFGNPTSSQLMRDRVRFTLYGFSNQRGLAYRDYLLQYSLLTDAFGITATDPVMRDAKMMQREIGVIAQKKTLDMTVSYYQGAVSDIATRLITSVTETFIIS